MSEDRDFSEFEAVPGWAPAPPADKLSDLIADGPDHPDYPPASDDLDWPEPLSANPCGAENRVRQTRTDILPWSAICYLIMRKPGGTYRGTGFFISPRSIVTAGHCIYTRRAGLARSIQVIPGRDAANWPYGSQIATEFEIPDEWRRHQDQAFDYGVITLPDDRMGRRTGHFAFDNLSTDTLRRANLNTSGYPSDMARSDCQHFNGGPCTGTYQQRLYYFLDTWKGASGSPIWVKSGDERIAVGIHNYGHCPNKATRINARVRDDLKRWSGE